MDFDTTPQEHPLRRRGDIKGADLLRELALDLRWSWNHAADEIWERLDPGLWKLTHNPWLLLRTISQKRLRDALSDPVLRKDLSDLVKARRREATSPAWFQKAHPGSPLTGVAYFSMEFMLSEALPIYSGGLGNVAGDQIKSAGDLGLPVTGVGLLYQQGYFRQAIDEDGCQQALYPYNEPGQLPISPMRDTDGEWLRLLIPLPGFPLWLRAWEVRVGRVRLLLLDSNDPANHPAHRGITSELYGGGPETRLKQELILGMGGWRLLRAAGLRPEVCHLNEGHAAFAILERARDFMEESKRSFEEALAVTRAGNLFTTHTAVPAGFDRFPPSLIESCLGPYAEQKLGISLHELLGLGRQDPNDDSEPFNMAYLALRGSGAVNGVSSLHGEVSRRIFQPLFPRWPQSEVPIGHVTNGVHMRSWDSAHADRLWSEIGGAERWRSDPGDIASAIRRIPDAKLWEMRASSRKALVDYIRERLSLNLSLSGAPRKNIERAKRLFDPDALTIGFARRFAVYKRPNLLLSDPDRLARILRDLKRPVQLIIAGKAHPADGPGQAMIRDWIQFIRRPEMRDHAVFLSDYDMLLTERLAQGVDVWINTPRRPWEASGTSGMKVLVNGGLNCSVLDGWWAEAYAPEVGWRLGDGQEHGDDPSRDAADAQSLYDVLEREVIPGFYDRTPDGVPVAWISRIRESMARLTPRYSTNRSVREYAERHYLPAAEAYLRRARSDGAAGERISAWRREFDQKWERLRFGARSVQTHGASHFFEVELHLGDLDPVLVGVELFAEPRGGGRPYRREMKPAPALQGNIGGRVYCAMAPADRPETDYTARAVPRLPDVAVPLEIGRILWQE
jgi:starch phosphorylase